MIRDIILTLNVGTSLEYIQLTQTGQLSESQQTERLFSSSVTDALMQARVPTSRNLDGGGSTGMWVNGTGMINYKDGSWRAVKSTLGFFGK